MSHPIKPLAKKKSSKRRKRSRPSDVIYIFKIKVFEYTLIINN